MKFKSILLSGLVLMGMSMTSCDNQDDATYEPATSEAVPAAYFTLDENGKAFDCGANQNSISVTVYRLHPEAAASVPVTVKCEEDITPFTYPSSANFAAGEMSTNFEVQFDPNIITVGDEYHLSFVIGDGSNTPYYLQTLNVSVAYNPWVPVIGPRGEKYATYTDGILDTWFKVQAVPYEIPLEQNAAKPGIYRIVNPYGADYPYNEEGDYDGDVHYLYFNATDPEQVFLCFSDGQPNHGSDMYIFETGLDWNPAEYGEVLVTGLYNLRAAQGNMDAALPNAGKLENGVLTFPERSLLARMDIYTAPGDWSYANTKGNFKLVFPGVKENAPVGDWTGCGTAQFTDAWIYPLFGEDGAHTWEVAVETDGKGTFRLVNPYKAGIMPDGIDYQGDKYIEFNVSNTACAKIEPQLCGFADSQDGEIAISNVAGYYSANGISDDRIIANNLGDTYDPSTYTMTVAQGNATVSFPLSPDAETAKGLYSPKIKIEGKIVMTNAAATAARVAAAADMNYSDGFVKNLKRCGLNVQIRPTKSSLAKRGKRFTKITL